MLYSHFAQVPAWRGTAPYVSYASPVKVQRIAYGQVLGRFGNRRICSWPHSFSNSFPAVSIPDTSGFPQQGPTLSGAWL